MRQDHPRGCGEHGRVIAHKIAAHYALRERIIPADAGSTKNTTATIIVSRDHPRGCGEHINTTILENIIQGSSPRMRGARGPC